VRAAVLVWESANQVALVANANFSITAQAALRGARPNADCTLSNAWYPGWQAANSTKN